ncbi:MAG TPA: glycosyltransferase family 87 protein [Candidatus Dormibacteraeota bacterium]|nr:glycosyltransferase family 87 protein [Candidatus Dormibacteraeota bacterium]
MIEAIRRYEIPAAGELAIRRLLVSGFVLVVVIFCAARLLNVYPWNERLFDLWAYWSTRFGLDYSSARPGASGAYIYSPAFAHLISPLTALPLPVFTALWTALVAATLYWLAGWRSFLIGLFIPVVMSIAIGQTDLFMAAAIIIGFRWPVVWVLPIVTKLTPGIGLLWFAVRREWRSLAIALAATAIITTASFLIDPKAWFGWLAMLARMDFPAAGDGVYLPVPVWIRLPFVALLIGWGARSNRRWVLPVGVCLSLPTVWLNTPAILVAILPMLSRGAQAPAGRWLRATGPLIALPQPHWRRRVRRAGLVLRRELGGASAFAAVPASDPSPRPGGDREPIGR